MNSKLPLIVFPSQLPVFKTRAKQLAEAVSLVTDSKILSSFKRNDLLAQAIGYKGYSDLTYYAKKHHQADNQCRLSLFSNERIIYEIKYNLVCRFPGIGIGVVEDMLISLSEKECTRMFLINEYTQSSFLKLFSKSSDEYILFDDDYITSGHYIPCYDETPENIQDLVAIKIEGEKLAPMYSDQDTFILDQKLALNMVSQRHDHVFVHNGALFISTKTSCKDSHSVICSINMDINGRYTETLIPRSSYIGSIIKHSPNFPKGERLNNRRIFVQAVRAGLIDARSS